MLNLFQYSFVLRALEAGLIVAFVAPLIGIFLVLRRYSLIADTLAHVSLSGIALGLLFGLNPIFIPHYADQTLGEMDDKTFKEAYSQIKPINQVREFLLGLDNR